MAFSEARNTRTNHRQLYSWHQAMLSVSSSQLCESLLTTVATTCLVLPIPQIKNTYNQWVSGMNVYM